MRVYQLCVRPDESDAEGRDLDEWFASRKGALARRRELIRQIEKDVNPQDGLKYVHDLEIYVWETTSNLTRNELVIALLNGVGWAKAGSQQLVKEAYDFGPIIQKRRKKAEA